MACVARYASANTSNASPRSASVGSEAMRSSSSRKVERLSNSPELTKRWACGCRLRGPPVALAIRAISQSLIWSGQGAMSVRLPSAVQADVGPFPFVPPRSAADSSKPGIRRSSRTRFVRAYLRGTPDSVSARLPYAPRLYQGRTFAVFSVGGLPCVSYGIGAPWGGCGTFCGWNHSLVPSYDSPPLGIDTHGRHWLVYGRSIPRVQYGWPVTPIRSRGADHA